MTPVAAHSCTNSAQLAAKAALVRRIEAAHRTNEDRQDAPRNQQSPRPAAAARTAQQPLAALAAQIIGGLDASAPVASGYDAYLKASRLLQLESRRVDVTGL